MKIELLSYNYQRVRPSDYYVYHSFDNVLNFQFYKNFPHFGFNTVVIVFDDLTVKQISNPYFDKVKVVN